MDTIADFIGKDEKIKNLKRKLKNSINSCSALKKQRIKLKEEHQDEIKSLRKQREYFRGSVSSLKGQLDKYDCKSVNLLRGVLKLKHEGLLKMTLKEIADRHFVSYRHVTTLSALMKRQAKK